MRLAVAVVLFGVGALHAQTPVSAAEREAHWNEDLRFFADSLSASGTTVDLQRGISSRGQKDFAKLYPKFKSQMESLQADVPKLSDSEVVLRLMQIVASANIAHNSIEVHTMGFFARLPLTLRWYRDGLAVVGASEPYSTAIGTRVLSIGKMTPDELLAGVRPYISHENDVWLREMAADFLPLRAVLEHFGLFDAQGRVSLTLQKPGGEPFAQLVPLSNPTQVVKIPLREALHVPVPVAASQPGKFYWHQYLADSQTLYVQYNNCANDPKLPFGDFARKVLADADGHTIKRVVIDLRQNGGGNSTVINPLKSGLESRLKKVGRVYVLIGPLTFSSASMNAADLRKSLHAVLAGEASGGLPGGYGEVKTFTLPNSKLGVRFTSKNFGDPKGDSLMPDLPAPQTLADDMAGRDAALSAVIAAP